MTAALFAGAGIGAGLLLVLTGLAPEPAPLGRALAQLQRRRPDPLGFRDDASRDPARRQLGARWARTELGGRLAEAVAADLRVTGTTPGDYLAQRVSFALVGLLWAPVTAALMWAGGVSVGFALPLWVSLALAPVGFLYPAVLLRGKAEERRRSFRHALSACLDVVAISLAGGSGVESALHHGANAGHGWAFDELRHALLEGRLLGEPPWAALARLGDDLGVPELTELASSAALAGTEGARVRASLAAKARALRIRGLADVRASAESATERMTIPVVLLMVGFVIFIAFPAVDRVLNGI